MAARSRRCQSSRSKRCSASTAAFRRRMRREPGGRPMKYSPRSRSAFTLAAALLALQWSLVAQTPAPQAKRPLSYDVVDYWKSIQGTRLSDDGQWLAYATTAQSEDGDVVVRNLRTGQEFKQARGTAPAFTPDGRFVVFTIAQAKADEEREAQASAAATGGEET